MKCDICGKLVGEGEIHAIYGEDSSCICKQCFGKCAE